MSDQQAAHVEKLQRLNDLMHDTLTIIVLSTTTTPRLIAADCLAEYTRIATEVTK